MILNTITYINLDKRKEKYLHINSHIESSKVRSFKTSGIICEDYLSYPIIEQIAKNHKRYKGTIGCFLAHKQAILNLISCVDKTHCNDYCLIIEDDIIIKPIFWDFVKALRIEQEHDIIFFDSGRKLDLSKCIDSKQKIWEIYEDYPRFCGAFCYAIPNTKLQYVYDVLHNITIYQDVDRFLLANSDVKKLCCQSGFVKVNHKYGSDRDPTRTWSRKRV